MFSGWLWTEAKGDEPPTVEVLPDDSLMDYINDNYSSEHLEKWKDVQDGKYYLEHDTRTIFRFNNSWYYTSEGRVDEENIYMKMNEHKKLKQGILSMFLNPETKLHPFDYDKVRDTFGEKKWTTIIISYVHQSRYTYYYKDDKLMIDASPIMEKRYTSEVESDPYYVSEFVDRWIYCSTFYKFEQN